MQLQQHDIETMTRLLQAIQRRQNLLEFETIQLPFELTEASLQLWEATFHPDVLRQLANADVETLEAWAIALAKTLQTQLEILNAWLPHLSTLPLPTTLTQKIRDRAESIGQIASDKSKLIQSAASLLSQDKQLHQDRAELQSLQDKVKELQDLESQLSETNLESLRQSIEEKNAELEPQQQVLRSLQQQKNELDDQIAALQQQQTALQAEITYWQSRQNRLETSTTETVAELIVLTQSQREHLSGALANELTNLEQQRTQLQQQQDSYRQAQQQLQKAQEDFKTYQTSTEETLTILTTHYQSNGELGNLLPANRQQIDRLFQAVNETLAEIDRELATARRQHEQAQQKKRFTL
jgi:chromosome segregation ATPase